MAEVTGFRNNALPYPVYAFPWGVVFPILDADGDLVTGAASLDSEVSLNGNTFADCTNEATEIATSSGMYYLLLTSAEMTADVVTVIVKTATAGAKTTPMVFYPRKTPTLHAGTAAGGSSSTITLDAGASTITNYYAGAVCYCSIDAVFEMRIIMSYDGSTKVATIQPNWVTDAPDSNDGFLIVTDALLVQPADVQGWLGAVPATPTVAGVPEVDVTHWIGTAAATPTVAGVPEVDVTHLNGVAQSLQDLKDFADDGYDPATNKVQGVVLVDTVTTVNGLAAGVITASALATDAVGEIQAGLYGDAAVWIDTVNGTAGTTAYVNGTQAKPCSTLASAVTIAAAVGLRRFRLINGSSITLASSYTDWVFISDGFGTIALGGQALGSVQINNCFVSGTATTGLITFENCALFAITIPPNTGMEHCTFVGPITFGAAGDYYVFDSEAAIIGGVPVTFDFGVALGSSTLQMRKWTGTISLANMGQSGTDQASVTGEGRVEIAASCQNSTVLLAGHLALANSGTNMTITEAPNYRSTTAAGLTGADVTAVSTDTTAADNLETALDGGSFNVGGGGIVVASDTELSAAQAEPTTVPAANASPLAKLAWVGLLARNTITQTATQQKVLADNAVTVVGTSAVSDDGTTATRGEFA